MDDQQIVNELQGRTEAQQDSIIRIVKDNRKPKEQKPTMLMIADSVLLDPEDDQIQRYPIAKIIADQIASTTKISTYSIVGDWGSGKSTVMGWVKKELDEQHKEVLTIPFDPWKYESLGNIILPLIAKVKAENASGIDFDTKVMNRIFTAVAILAGSIAIVHFIGWIWLSKVWAFCIKIVKKLPIEGNKKKKDRGTYEALNLLHEDFENLVDYVLKSRQEPKQKIVFLIDDLDRCSPDNVVLMLESIKNFLRTEKTCFVFAIDKEVVSKGVRMKYGGNESGVDGNAYLEKLIDFEFELPFNPEDYSLRLLRFYERSTDFPKGNVEFAHRLFQVADVRSIRTMKKILNRYVYLHKIGFEVFKGEFNPQMLHLLVFNYEIYPEFYHLLKFYRFRLLSEIVNHKCADLASASRSSVDPMYEKFMALDQPQDIKEIIDVFMMNAYNWNSLDGRNRQQVLGTLRTQLDLCFQIAASYAVKNQ